MNVFKQIYDVLDVMRYVMFYVNVDTTNLLPAAILVRIFVFRLTIYEVLVSSSCIVNWKVMWVQFPILQQPLHQFDAQIGPILGRHFLLVDMEA